MELSEKLKKYRISTDEYKLICNKLGREPEGLEWAVFSSLWSEHCSYKSSKVHLKGLYRDSEKVLQSFGENAGVVDLGLGEKIAFKMESHNHPSFIEPYQGAATGVGGILRDIFTMGARPIALANYLCFGEPQAPRMKKLVDGVVRGIGGYGNCVGVPTVTGHTEFNKKYNKNILVNAFALGIFDEVEDPASSKIEGVGNYVVYVGAKTGRDGIHGASMASEAFDENSTQQLPTIQIGDPFYEKLLIEACLEVMANKLVVAIQDMGAAGLTSSCFEMAEKGNVGIHLDLSKIPLRDSTLEPEEILLSESQERMLLVCEPAQFEKIKVIFDKWNIDAEIVGKVTDDKLIRLIWKDKEMAAISPDLVVNGAPEYERPFNFINSQMLKTSVQDLSKVDAKNIDFDKRLSSFDSCSRDWVYEQYDQRVGASTIRDCTNTIGVVALTKTDRALGVSLGCRPKVMEWNSYIGGLDSIAYPALKLACKGFEVQAVTDCLNFGNPEKNEIMSEFVSSLRAMNTLCEQLDAPIISGNVSFYNETEGADIISTPSTGLVGLKKSLEFIPDDFFKSSQEKVFSVKLNDFGKAYFENDKIFSNEWKLKDESLSSFIKTIYEISLLSNVSSSRVVGLEGLSDTLTKMSEKNNIGFKLDSNINEENLFFGVFYEVIFSGENLCLEDFNGIKNDNLFSVQAIGQTQSDNKVELGKNTYNINDLKKSYNSWSSHFENLA